MSAMPNIQAVQIGIEHNDRPAILPTLHPTIGPPMADIRGLCREAGCYAYDPALGETGICRSAITYVDGDNGVLLYRGYPIADLASSIPGPLAEKWSRWPSAQHTNPSSADQGASL